MSGTSSATASGNLSFTAGGGSGSIPITYIDAMQNSYHFPSGCSCGPWHSIVPPPPCPVHSQTVQVWNGAPLPNPNLYGGAKPYVAPFLPGVPTVTTTIAPDDEELEPEASAEEAIAGLREMLEELG